MLFEQHRAIMHGLDLIPSFKEDLGRKTRSLSSSAEFWKARAETEGEKMEAGDRRIWKLMNKERGAQSPADWTLLFPSNFLSACFASLSFSPSFSHIFFVPFKIFSSLLAYFIFPFLLSHKNTGDFCSLACFLYSSSVAWHFLLNFLLFYFLFWGIVFNP